MKPIEKIGPAQVLAIRQALGLSQALFGRMLGAHKMTVSRWERGTLTPSASMAAMMHVFQMAAEARPELVHETTLAAEARGVPFALWRVLSALFIQDDPRGLC